MDTIHSLDQVVKVVAHGRLIYVATPNEIVVVNLRRHLKGKDILKQKIAILPTMKTLDEFTQTYNDNKKGQVDFVKFAMRDGYFPIVHSSLIEQRLVTLNSTSPKIKDFYIYNGGLLVLCNNGALVYVESQEQQRMIVDGQVIAMAADSNRYAYYIGDELIVGSIVYPLVEKYKDDIQMRQNLIVMHNTLGHVLLIEGQILRIINLYCLSVQIISDTNLYCQQGNTIIDYNIKNQQQLKVYEAQVMSKGTYLNGNIYYRNGMICKGINAMKSSLSTIDTLCSSSNGVVTFLCGQVGVRQEKHLIAHIDELTPVELIERLVIQIRQGGQAVDFSDVTMYLQKYDQYYATLEIALQLYDGGTKRKGNDDHRYLYEKYGDIQQIGGIILINLLILQQKPQAYQEVYISLYLAYLTKLPQTERIKQQMLILQSDLQKTPLNLSSYVDKCPICNDDLVHQTSCTKHKFMRCNITQVPLANQRLQVCKVCGFHAVHLNDQECQLYHYQVGICPVCCGQMKYLLK